MPSTGFTTDDGLPGSWVAGATLDRNQDLWLTFDGGGIARYEGRRCQHYTRAHGLPADSCNFIKQDHTGTIWLGTASGTCRLTNGAWEVVDPVSDWRQALIDILVERDGTLWGIEHHSAVRRYHNGTWEQCLDPAEDSYNNGVLARSFDGSIWCANGAEAVHRYADGAWTSYGAADGVPPGQVRALAVDQTRRRVWIGTTWGEVGYYQRGQFHEAPELTNTDQYCILALYVDRRDRVWVGTEGDGVVCWDGQTTRRFNYQDGLPVNQANRIGEDRQGRMVFCTFGGGVSLYDGEMIVTLDSRNGLRNDTVRGFLHDPAGSYWFATDAGLTCYRPVRRTPVLSIEEVQANRLYRPVPVPLAPPSPRPDAAPQAGPAAAPGSPEPDSSDTQRAADSSGSTGAAGAPDGPVMSDFAPPLDIEHAAPDDTHNEYHGDAPLPLPSGIYVPVSRRSVRIRFRAVSLAGGASAVIFRCRLGGHAPKWHVMRACEITYEGLPIGSYTFQVQAVDQDFNYSEPASLGIEVYADREEESLVVAVRSTVPKGTWVGSSPASRKVLSELRRVASSDMTVLITGATGTGKTLAAGILHNLHPRRNAGPFITVSCGAIPIHLVESELFGHERGAFTGAVSLRLGKAELANGGTLFLDEVAEMPPEAQVRLLRLLEDRTFERVGGTKTLQTDVRVIAATNRILAERIQEGRFRQDLFYRLNVYPVTLPTLRERREDIEDLVTHFLRIGRRHTTERGAPLGMTRAALAALQQYDWPGNIRELCNIVERVNVTCGGREIEVEDLGVTTPEEQAVAGPRPGARDEIAAFASALATAVLSTASTKEPAPPPAAESPEATPPPGRSTARPRAGARTTGSHPLRPYRPPAPADVANPGDATTAADAQAPPPSADPRRPPLPSLTEVERAYIVQILQETGWVISGPNGAATVLGMPESTLRSRMKALGIRRPPRTGG